VTHTLIDSSVRDDQVATLEGATATLTNARVAELRASLRGNLICPQDTGYDESRAVWNRNIDKHPALIAECVGAADVITCVNFARDNDVLVSVRGGGHNFSGTAVADDGLVIDLSRMNSIRVDPALRTVRAEGGTKWGQFDRETQAFGLASTGGTNYDTGIGGLTLGGGMGWLAGKYGLALDNLVSADVVAADGSLRTASVDENPDLFWAIRGGGGNFGVVTSLEYRLHEVGPLMTCLAFYPLDRAVEILSLYDEFAASVPDEINSAAGVGTLPEGPVVAIAAAYNGPLDAGERALQPLRRFGEPLMLQVQPMPYVQVQHWLDAFTPEGQQYFETAHFMRDIPDGASEALLDAYHHTSSPGNLLFFQQLGNATNRVPTDATAFGHRDARYALILIAQWSDHAETARHAEWTRALRTATAPYATGGIYVNAIGRPTDSGSEIVRSAFGPNYKRLSELKRAYDPRNLFRHNQNITPTDQPAH
jgi:FAD/FMN-containing dehydrogenase